MVRRAKLSDLDAVYTLFKSVLWNSENSSSDYLVKIQKEGYLSTDGTKEEFSENISHSPYFYVYEQEGTVYGFLSTTTEREFIDNEFKTWLEPFHKPTYYVDRTAYMTDRLAVSKDVSLKGVGTTLLRRLENDLRNDGFKHLFSLVRILPYTNCASILFHTKNNFKVVAVSQPRDFLGIKNNAMFLYYKSL